MAFKASMAGVETDVSIVNNSSNIQAKFTIKTDGDSYNNTGNAWYEISCAGKSTGRINFTISKNSSKTFTHTLGPYYHNADGSLGNLTLSGTAYCKSGTTKNASCQVSFTTIPRTSSFSISGTTLGSNTRVSISRASSSFYHTVIYQMGNVYAEYGNISDTCDFTRPYSDANQFGGYSTSGTGTITVITYNNGSEIGRTSQNVVMYLPDNGDTKPYRTSSTTINDSISAISTKFGAFIQNNSQPTFHFNYSGRNGAGISNYTLTINGRTYTSSSSSITTAAITESGSINYTCTIRDTRGRTTSESGTINVLTYTKPQITLDVERTADGMAALCHVVASITSVNSLNDKNVVIRYKPHTSSTYVSQIVSFDEGEYTLDKTIQIPIADNLSYDFYGAAVDFFGEEDTAILPISTVFDLLHFGNDGESIAVGKKVERNKTFEIQLDLYYKGVSIDDYIRQIIDERNGN